jgi:hypothetical protein
LAEWISSCDGLPPCVKPILPFGVVARSSKKVSFRPEVSSEDSVDFEKALRLLRRLEALHRRSRIGSSERIAPATDLLVAQLNASIGHHQFYFSQEFYFSQAHCEVKVQPHALGNDLFRKSVTVIWIGWPGTSITPVQCDNALNSAPSRRRWPRARKRMTRSSRNPPPQRRRPLLLRPLK